MVFNDLQPLLVPKLPPVLLAASQQPAHRDLHAIDLGSHLLPCARFTSHPGFFANAICLTI